MHTYPLTSTTKTGQLFWTLPKRPPTENVIDPNNPLHASMISAFACLRAQIFHIPIPNVK